MRLHDRYILFLFVKNYLMSLAVLIGLYIVMDMVFGFDKIVSFGSKAAAMNPLAQVWAALADVADYYFYHSFLIFVQLSGIIPVVAAAFTFLRLSRFNELTAFLAAGVPTLRLTVPVVAAAVVLNGVLVADQELVLPRMIDKLTVKADEMHQAARSSFAIKAMPVDAGTVLMAAQYFPPTRLQAARMEYVTVLERDGARPIAEWTADGAVWDEATGRWNLTAGKYVRGLTPDAAHGPVTPATTYRGRVTPEAIALYRGSAVVDLLGTGRINALIASGSYGASRLYRTKYLRYAQPVMNVVLLLLAVPTVLTYDAKTLRRSAGRALTLLGLAMGSVFVCQQIAANPPLGDPWVAMWPALMSFVPIAVFLPVAVWQMERVRT